MMQQHLYRPPRKMYAFEDGWDLTWNGARAITGKANSNAKWWSDQISGLQDEASDAEGGVAKFFYYTGVIICFLINIVQYCVLMLVLLVWVSVLVLILSTWAGYLLLLLGIVRGCSWLYIRYYRIYYPCPYCYHLMPLPTFMCAQCHAPHSRLWPNTYGIFSHRCRCGTKLPTLNWRGRNKLRLTCPYCNYPLDNGFGQGTNINIPIIGGQSAGKTNYIVTAIQAFQQTYEKVHHYTISFTNAAHEQNFQARIASLSRGEKLAPTPEITPLAYSLKIKAPKKRVPTIAFIYDPAGEAFNRDATISLQTYCKYIHACIFVIDPCAIPAYRRVYQHDIELIRDALGPSEGDVEEVYDRSIKMLETYRKVKRIGSYRIPIAVVVTKADALGLQDKIGMPAAQGLTESNAAYQTPAEAINFLVQDFLHQYGLDNLMRKLKEDFSEVRYFSCSALGRLPSDTDKSAFTPTGVLEPLEWLFVRTRAVKDTAKA
jgi:Double-GTPase 2